MSKLSSGLLVYKRNGDKVEVLLVHPGGPFWVRKDEHAWSTPKGEYLEGEDPILAAKREFEEEIGQPAPEGEYLELGEMKRSDGKVVKAFAVEGYVDISNITSNTIMIDWPPRSGKKLEIPEVDKAQWFDLSTAISKMHRGQEVFIERLAESLSMPLEAAQSSLF